VHRGNPVDWAAVDQSRKNYVNNTADTVGTLSVHTFLLVSMINVNENVRNDQTTPLVKRLLIISIVNAARYKISRGRAVEVD